MQIPPEINHDPNGHEEALYAALRQAEEEKNSRYQKAWKYFDEWGNRVSVLTLLFVAAYTIVTFDIFFVGNRAFIYSPPWRSRPSHIVRATMSAPSTSPALPYGVTAG